MGEDEVSVRLSLEQDFRVAEQKPARVVVYDYYDPEVRSELAYSQTANPTIAEACPNCWPHLASKAPRLVTE